MKNLIITKLSIHRSRSNLLSCFTRFLRGLGDGRVSSTKEIMFVCFQDPQIHQDQLATLLLIFNGFSFPPELIWLKFFLHSGTSRKFLVQLPNDGVYLPRSVFSSQACELGSIFQYMTARHDWELGSGPIKHVSLRSKKPPKKLKESVGSLALLSSRK